MFRRGATRFRSLHYYMIFRKGALFTMITATMGQKKIVALTDVEKWVKLFPEITQRVEIHPYSGIILCANFWEERNCSLDITEELLAVKFTQDHKRCKKAWPIGYNNGDKCVVVYLSSIVDQETQINEFLSFFNEKGNNPSRKKLHFIFIDFAK